MAADRVKSAGCIARHRQSDYTAPIQASRRSPLKTAVVCLREPHARDLMQKILDRSQESLEYAFASLAKTAKRQQRVYLATIGSLMLMVAVFALVIAVVAAFKQLEYRRTFTSQNATDLSLLLHREESFLRRAEFTLDYYYGATDVRRAPEAVEQSIAQTGAARGTVDRVDAEFDVVIGQSTQIGRAHV